MAAGCWRVFTTLLSLLMTVTPNTQNKARYGLVTKFLIRTYSICKKRHWRRSWSEARRSYSFIVWLTRSTPRWMRATHVGLLRRFQPTPRFVIDRFLPIFM